MNNTYTFVRNYIIMIKGTQTNCNNYLIKQLPNATVFLNNNLEVVHVSDKFVDDYDLVFDTIIGKPIELIFKTITQDCIKSLKSNLKGEKSQTHCEFFVTKNKEEKRFKWKNVPWYDEHENIIGVIIQTEDITKRVLDELKLEKLESVLNGKSEIAKIGTWEYDIEKNSLHWCNITKSIHEVPMDFVPVIEDAIDFYKIGFSRNTISMAVNNTLKNGTPWSEKLQIVTAKGKELWVTASGKPVYNNDKIVGIIGTFQDINDSVLSQIKIKESEHLLKTLIDNLPINVYIKDIESRKVLVNKAECDFAGVSNPEEILGKNDFQLYNRKTAQEFRDEDLEVIKTGKPILGKETICKAKDGSTTSILVYKLPLVNSKNEIEGIIGMSLDITETRKAQQKLEEKERNFKSIFNSSYQFTGILDLDGTLIELNDTALKFAAERFEDVIGKKFWDQSWWPKETATQKLLKQTIKTALKGETIREEIKIYDPNKKLIPIDFSLKPIYNDKNKVVSLLAEGRMIAEMVAAREKIKESELKFRTLYELSPVSFVLYDFNTGKIIDFNTSFKNTFGYNEESLSKLKFWDLFKERNDNHRKQAHEELNSKGTFGPFGEKLNHRKGAELTVIINKSMIVNKKGEKLVWTIIQDITETEEKERQIREERKLLKTVVDNLPLNVYIKDRQSRKILVNKAECDYMNVENADEILGKNDFELYDEETAQLSRNEDLQVFKTLKPILGAEKINKCRNGENTTFLTSKIPLKGENGKAYGLVGISLDISELKQKEEELRSLINVTSLQNKKLINFAHIVSHNLRSHSANFSMLLEFMINENNEEEKRTLTKMLVEASDNLLETLDNLNEVLAINSNVNLKKSSLNLNHNLNKIKQNLAVFLKDKNVKIINNIPDHTNIQAIPAYAESILMNFITNAVKYKSPDRDPVIKLGVTQKSGYTILSIEDNGMGIDLKKYGEKLFGLYKTFHDNPDAKGIGLYMSKNQIEAMNGKITVTSKVGIGSTFNIYFNEKN
ncbi:PAS domain S-box protein [Maribacter sp. TH_r10]|uniref:PAS domain-containing sensor histidine kinase n=1 Tax=Maribacter sp. TH_r10 TaxID=3082086 RepID=UPI0029535FC3|nr:PAS domain S-box protein [Maribacter sp. TH_r10]MDV7140929.1 PAS domain S-box protein [Maribacter sp. TH_r10]